jgi:hypothetical protein
MQAASDHCTAEHCGRSGDRRPRGLLADPHFAPPVSGETGWRKVSAVVRDWPVECTEATTSAGICSRDPEISTDMERPVLQTLLLTFPLVLCPACDGTRAEPEQIGAAVCTTIEAGQPLAGEVRETSGLALSGRAVDVVWTHNDRGNDPILYSLSADGALLGRVTVTGAELVDWEDLEAGPCAAGRCLYIGDIGDNDGNRSTITIYEVAEPRLADGASDPVTALRARYPDGTHNAESLFMLPGGDLYIVTKGDVGPVMLYRYPQDARGDSVVTLELVRETMSQPRDRSGYVTGATTSPDGQWVAVRTYGALYFYPAEPFVSGADVAPIAMDLGPLREAQGEGVAMGEDGTVWLTSEAENNAERPRRARLMCTLPGQRSSAASEH